MKGVRCGYSGAEFRAVEDGDADGVGEGYDLVNSLVVVSDY